MKIRGQVFFLSVPLLCMVLPACVGLSPAQNQGPPPEPLFVIKVDRDKSLAPSAVDDSSLDKFFSDEIEQPGLSRDRFDRILADAIIKFDPTQELVSIKDHNISLKRSDGTTSSTFTDNAWAVCREIPGGRKRSLRMFLSSSKEIGRADFNKNSGINDVVPLVRSTEMIEQTSALGASAQGAAAESLKLAWHPIAPGIVCVYASDSPNSLAMLSAEKAAQFGLGAADMKKVPLQNLLSHLPTDISVYAQNGVFMVTCGGDFESSLILDDRLMSALKKRVKGRLVFGVSNKDVLIAADGGDPSAVARARQLIERNIREGSRPVSDKLYYWDDGKITLWQ